MHWLALTAFAVVFYHRPVAMLVTYLRDRQDFERQVAAIYAAIAQEA